MGHVSAPPLSASHRADDTIAFRSTQSIVLPDVPDAFDDWGTAHRLVDLLRAYFFVAESSVGRLARTRWRGTQPELALFWPSVPFITMDEPAIELSADRRAISVGITGGLLVMPSSQSRLVIELIRGAFGVHARVDLVGYQPRGGRCAIVRWTYGLTQARVHTGVGRRYLRQLCHEWPPSSR